MASIGNRPVDPREQHARKVLDMALMEREGFVFRGIEPAANGSGVIAVVVNGEKTIMHLGRDKADAMFGLAALARRPLGRDGR